MSLADDFSALQRTATSLFARDGEIRGPELSVSLDRHGFSARTHAKDRHGQVYEGLILMDTGAKRPYRAAMEWITGNLPALSKMRRTHDIRNAVNEVVEAKLGKRPIWHSYHMPD
jgi:hypothetical protein